ncbi:MAG: HlyD family type I secretion periplasmic adaptor subunit, partial [Magnetococcales bacterium]|nr:HlyD family type I secretion periplasmic adaptor subunit [Magnetococcales bacterium]MBF0115585.1 HlyD family type I secretion periplasmic adaptor subunit [Magnetococcales bacterium]
MNAYHRLQAIISLLRRYQTVFMHAWHLRNSMRSEFFNKQEAEFLPAGLSLQEMPDSPTLRHIVTHISNIHLFLALYGQSKVMDPL